MNTETYKIINDFNKGILYDESYKTYSEYNIFNNIHLLPVYHSFKINDEQNIHIEEKFNDFLLKYPNKDNCRVIIEGALRGEFVSMEDAITKGGGEGGYMTYLAKTKGVECVCYEPTKQEIIKGCIEAGFKPDEIFLQDIMSNIFQMNNEKIESDNEKREYIEWFIDKYNQDCGTNYDYAKLSEIHKIVFNKEINIYDLEFAYTISNPYDQANPLRLISNCKGEIRDVYIIDEILKNDKAGTVQFVVYGESHIRVYNHILKLFGYKND